MKPTILFLIFLVTLIGCTETERLKSKVEPRNDNQKSKTLSSQQDSIVSLLEMASKASSLENNDFANSIWCDSISKLVSELRMDDTIFKTLDDETIDLSKISKPIFLQVTSAWSTPYKTEIPELNKLVEIYSDKVQFILVFAEDSSRLTDKRPNYHEDILLIPNTKWEMLNGKTSIGKIEIDNFIHRLGFPFNYYVTRDKKIVKAEIGDTECNKISPSSFNKKRELIYSRMKLNIDYLLKMDTLDHNKNSVSF